MLISAPLQSPEAVGYGIHVLSPAGTVLGSFGGDGNFDVRCLLCLRYRLAREHDQNLFWVVPPNQYEIWLVDIDGRTRRKIEVSGSWFEQPSQPNRPNVFVQAIHQDEAGLLWISGTISPPPPPRDPGGVAAAPQVRDIVGEHTSTVIDVIDPATLKLLATIRLPGEHRWFGDRFLSRTRETADGNAVLEIVQVRLER